MRRRWVGDGESRHPRPLRRSEPVRLFPGCAAFAGPRRGVNAPRKPRGRLTPYPDTVPCSLGLCGSRLSSSMTRRGNMPHRWPASGAGARRACARMSALSLSRARCAAVVLVSVVLQFGLVLPGCGRNNSDDPTGAFGKIMLREPRNHELWPVGRVATVEWKAQGVGGEIVVVEASRDSGLTWDILGTESARTAQFNWSPTEVHEDVRVRVRTADSRVISKSRRIDVVPRVSDVQFGTEFGVARMSDGTLRFWGEYPASFARNESRPYGEGYPYYETRPVPLEGFSRIVTIAAGGEHLLAIRDDGTLLFWGDHDGFMDGAPSVVPEPVPEVRDPIAVSAGFFTSFAVTAAGEVFAWGGNARGNLGDGTDSPRVRPIRVPALDGIRALAVGNQHNVALLNGGAVLAWGWNGAGQLGDGATEDRWTPVGVPGIPTAVAVAARGQFSLVLSDSGEVFTWGSNAFGQLGDGTQVSRLTPGSVVGLRSIVRIAAGFDSGYALDSQGALFGWGSNSRGELCDGSFAHRAYPVRTTVSGVVELFTGDTGAHATDIEGAWLAWGSNYFYEVGDGSPFDRAEAVELRVR